MSTEGNWHTNEVHLHMVNDEPSYRQMLRCKTFRELVEAFDRGGITGVDYRQVQWKLIWEWTAEDRAA